MALFSYLSNLNLTIMEIITNNPIAAIIIAIVSVLGIGIVVRVKMNKGKSNVNQTGNTAGGHISGRDTIIKRDGGQK